MFATWVRTISTALKRALGVGHGRAIGEHALGVSKVTQGVIHEIEVGAGPAWGTLSGLTAHSSDPSRLYAITDKDSAPIRIIEIEITANAAKAGRQISVVAPGLDDLDTEGIAAKSGGGFWLAGEGGTGNVPPNVLVEVDDAGAALRVIHLPESLAQRMPKKGIEGIALETRPDGARLVVCFQAPINGDPEELTRIGTVDLATQEWRFFHYPLERTPSGDLTGLSELLHLGGGKFAAIERDGKGGKSSIKWLTTFDLGPSLGAAAGDTPPLLVKHRAVDLVPVFIAAGRKVAKEIEGLAVTVDGQLYAVTDNDNERATLLLRLGKAQSLL